MKVALVYDRVNKWGGAERVLLLLHELFPDAPLFTSVYNPTSAPWADVFSVKISFLQNLPFARTAHEWYPLLMPIAFESFNFDSFDLVISVTSESAKGVITKPRTKHICICLTPTRYLWSGYNEYFRNTFFRTLVFPITSYLKKWDLIAAERPDGFIAISEEVKRRIRKFYNRDSTVIYPPVLLQETVNNDKEQNNKHFKTNKSSQSYFLVVSRLVYSKRIDIAIKACNSLHIPLKIIGTGSEEGALKRIAGPTISFLGSLTDNDLVRYYRGCCALLFPGFEDFGLTVNEAHNFGKPVIAYKSGGVLETVIPGKTGEFFYPQTEKALADTINEMLKNGKLNLEQEEQAYYMQECLNQAKKFTKEAFNKQLVEYINNILKNK